MPETLKKPLWKTVTQIEVACLESKQVLSLREILKGTIPMKGKLNFAVKYKNFGTLKKSEARLLSQQFSQIY